MSDRTFGTGAAAVVNMISAIGDAAQNTASRVAAAADSINRSVASVAGNGGPQNTGTRTGGSSGSDPSVGPTDEMAKLKQALATYRS